MAGVVRVVRGVLLVAALVFLFNSVWTLFDGSDRSGGTFTVSWSCNADAKCSTSQPGVFTGSDLPKAIGYGTVGIALALLSIGLSPALWSRAGSGLPAGNPRSQAPYQQGGYYPPPGQQGPPGMSTRDSGHRLG